MLLLPPPPTEEPPPIEPSENPPLPPPPPLKSPSIPLLPVVVKLGRAGAGGGKKVVRVEGPRCTSLNMGMYVCPRANTGGRGEKKCAVVLVGVRCEAVG